jgi:tubulin-specific chaperone E
MSTFNELDKLKALNQLTFSPNEKTGGYEEMFSKAVGLIGQLKILNKVEIRADNRRGAEYDIWKMLATQWLQTENSPQERLAFKRKYRNYQSLVKSKQVVGLGEGKDTLNLGNMGT